jgi:hypothetical protein
MDNDKEVMFPKQLLDQPLEKRIDYFKKYTVAHPLLVEAFEKLTKNIYNPSNRSILFVYGPSGVGKTTLYNKTINTIIEQLLPTLEIDSGRIPIAGMEAISPDNGNFDWKDFYIRMLEEFNEIAIEHKIDSEMHFFKAGTPQLRIEDPNRKLRKACESTLRHRRPLAFIIDEAQHMMKMTSGRRLRNQMDSIKSLASLSKTPIVLIGTYELLKFRNLSGQLSRRSDDVHFSRYRIEKKGDLELFENVLWLFQKNMPLENEPNLTNYTDYFYGRCIGCVGTLKDWLVKTYEMKVLEGNKSLTVDDFEEYALSDDQCIKMIREAREGELKMEDSDEKKKELNRLLMMNSSDYEEEEQRQKPEPKKTAKTGRKKPGKRNPKRDTTGTEVKKEQPEAI